jgi:hypothetical protein
MNCPRRKTALLVIAACLLSASSAFAVLPPEAYEEARTSAQYHALIRVTSVVVPAKTPGECAVSGTVDELLRKANDDLAAGATLTLDVACRHTSDEIPDGGTLWTNIGALKRATVIEAFLNRDGDSYRIPRDQVSIKESGAAPDEGDSSRNIALYAGIGVGAVVAALVVFFLLRRRKD